jgi:hypothetical protein
MDGDIAAGTAIIIVAIGGDLTSVILKRPPQLAASFIDGIGKGRLDQIRARSCAIGIIGERPGVATTMAAAAFVRPAGVCAAVLPTANNLARTVGQYHDRVALARRCLLALRCLLDFSVRAPDLKVDDRRREEPGSSNS